MDQNNSSAHALLGEIYAARGMYREAIAEYQESIRLGNDSPEARILLGAAYAKTGQREKAQALLKQFETGKEYVSPSYMAILHAALNDREKAFASLEKAYAGHDPELQELRANTGFDSLRSDPRFTELMRKVGL